MEILDSLVCVIKQHMVHSFLVTPSAAEISFVCYVTWVITNSSWPKTNYTLISLDVTATRKLVEYHRRCVVLVQSDGVSIVIIDEYGCGRGTGDESAIVKPVCPAGKYSGANWKKKRGFKPNIGDKNF